tara:strand:- start:15 stop:530 length:516 start_codon:yes stop_codon:yes gene_type:complete
MIKKIFLILFILIFSQSLMAETPHYINFKYILNQSTAGKKAQDYLKKKLENGIKNVNDKEKQVQEEEKKIIQQKKIISQEEYKKKVTELRKKVANLQKERNKILQSVAKERAKAKNELLKNLNPIIKQYMEEKNIRMIIDKKNLILADETLDITTEIINRLNKNLKSIKLN